MDHPELHDEEELKKMLDDSEIADIYSAMSRTSGALTDTTEPDIDKEWNAFAERNFPSHRRDGHAFFRSFMSRKVASSAIIAFATLSIVAAGIGISYSISNKKSVDVAGNKEHTDSLSLLQNSVVSVQDSESLGVMETSIVIFKDAAFSDVLEEISVHYGIPVVYENETAKNLHLFFQWDRSLSLAETASQLNNFQQIDIEVSDNSIMVR